MVKVKIYPKIRNLFTHSCWRIFYFVLFASGLNLIAFKILFGKGVWKRKQKRKKKKKRKRPQPLETRPKPPPPALRPSNPAHLLRPRPRASPPLLPSFLRPTCGPHSFSSLTARPYCAVPFLLHRILGDSSPSSEPIPQSPCSPSYLVCQASIKPLDQPRDPLFASRLPNHALNTLAAINEIFPRPAPFPIAAWVTCYLPARAKCPGELAFCSCARPLSRFMFWCSETRSWRGRRAPRRRPWRTPAPALAPSRPAARLPPWMDRNRRMLDQRPRSKDTPLRGFFFKRPWKIWESTRGPKAYSQFYVFPVLKAYSRRLSSNVFSSIYKFATEIKLLIKYSF